MHVSGLAGIGLDLLTQSPDMYIHCTHITGIIRTPYQLQQILPAVYLVGIQHQKFQHFELLGRQSDLPALDVGSFAVTIQLHIAAFQNTGVLCGSFFRLHSAEDSFDPGFHFQNVKRLGYVIVRAVFQSQDLIHVITLGGQHDHRYIGKFADLLADLKAGQLR